MADEFVFDPNDADAFIEYWMERIGNDHLGTAYNGWVYLDQDRNVLDVCITDVEGKWLDADTADEAGPDGGSFDILARWGQEVDATNIIGIHSHPSEGGSGPCPGIGEFSGVCAEQLEQRGLRLRAMVELRGDKLEGIVWVNKVADGTTIGDLLQDAEPSDESRALRDMAESMLPRYRMGAALGDEGAARIVDVLVEIVTAFDEGRRPSMEMLLEGLRIASERVVTASNLLVPPKPTLIDPLGLPLFDPSKDRLN